MPTPPTTPPAEFDFLASAEAAHQEANWDFSVTLDRYFTRGYVFKTPTFFMLAEADPQRGDAWLVWWLEFHPSLTIRTRPHILLGTVLRHMPSYRPWIGWARTLKGRPELTYYSTDRLIRFSQSCANHHA